MFKRALRMSILGLSALLICGTTLTAHADNCDKRIRNAEKVDQAVRRHGEHSRQAEESRRHLADVRSICHR